MTYTPAQLLTRLRTKLRDTNDSKWTSSEKEECLVSGFEDPAVAYYAEDTSLTASTTIQSYTVPTGVEKIVDIWIIGTDGLSTRVSPSTWEQKYGKIVFNTYPQADGTMSLSCIKKYATTDTVPEEFAGLILAIAAYNAFEMLMNKFGSSFLTNDVSMAEIQAGLAYYDKKVREERAKSRRINNRLGYKL